MDGHATLLVVLASEVQDHDDEGLGMQGTKDRTFELGTTGQQSGGRRRTLVGGALVLALVAGGATAGALAVGLDREPRRTASTQDAAPGQGEQGQGEQGQGAVTQDAVTQDAVTQDDATGGTGTDGADEQASGGGTGAAAGGSADEPAPDAVPAGSYGVRVLGEGWDAQGRYVLVDRGRLTDGPAAEPGVDGTRPVVFDTGAVAERRRLDLADDHQFRFSRAGGEPSYGSGSWADFVTELSGRDAGMLATVKVDADGRLTRLEEPYRP